MYRLELFGIDGEKQGLRMRPWTDWKKVSLRMVLSVSKLMVIRRRPLHETVAEDIYSRVMLELHRFDLLWPSCFKLVKSSNDKVELIRVRAIIFDLAWTGPPTRPRARRWTQLGQLSRSSPSGLFGVWGEGNRVRVVAFRHDRVK